ncbi:MAG: hypothetical protein JXQ65_15610 [Candidatus Marinimicrobia bacterium]|nr:hypothetical protein [Candidatus Neomarinimicrobiota bacterium]
MQLQKLIFITLFLLILTNSLFSQWHFGLSNYSIYDDNIFRNYKKDADTYLVPGISISKSTSIMDYYFNSYNFFLNKNTALNNSVNTLGIDYYKTLTSDLYSNLGLNISGRIDKEEYNYYDYFKIETYGIFKWYSIKNGLTKIYMKTHSKSFPAENSWNHYEFALKLQHLLYLETGTTLKFDLEPIIRNFQPYSYQYNFVTYSDELPTLWQTIFNFRIAQSFTQNFGGYTEFQYRYNPSETNPYDPLIQSFSPIDDYFGYGGYEWRTNLKYKLTENLWLTTSGELYRDNYKNRAIYEYNFDTGLFSVDDDGYYIPLGKNRDDTGFIMNFGISYQISKLFNSPSNIILDIQYSNQVNKSNDPYFDYDNNSITLQLNYHTQF